MGVTPDLTVMGKVIGGGLPAAAYGGSRALMERIAPAGDVYQAGTLSGNPLAVAAGLVTLKLLDEQAYLRLAATTEALAAGLREAAGSRPLSVVTAPGLLTPFFAELPPRDYAQAKDTDRDAYAVWAGRCSPAASTRRRRRSRRGSRRSPHARARRAARSRPPPRRSRSSTVSAAAAPTAGLAELVRAEAGLLADAVRADGDDAAVDGDLARRRSARPGSCTARRAGRRRARGSRPRAARGTASTPSGSSGWPRRRPRPSEPRRRHLRLCRSHAEPPVRALIWAKRRAGPRASAPDRCRARPTF
jgi:hypothetical protein